MITLIKKQYPSDKHKEEHNNNNNMNIVSKRSNKKYLW